MKKEEINIEALTIPTGGRLANDVIDEKYGHITKAINDDVDKLENDINNLIIAFNEKWKLTPPTGKYFVEHPAKRIQERKPFVENKFPVKIPRGITYPVF